MHETPVDEFLERMGWRKAFCRLGFEMLPTFRTALYGLRRVRRWSGPPMVFEISGHSRRPTADRRHRPRNDKAFRLPPGRFFGDSEPADSSMTGILAARAYPARLGSSSNTLTNGTKQQERWPANDEVR
jgi:hypothetical protein